ncbi:MAG: redoxin domain-containing protein [Bacteroidota bacterium]
MRNIILATILSIFTFAQGKAQDNTQGHFLVEFDKFSPPIQDLIRSFEGQPAEQFLANDVSGTEHYLGDYTGKKVILWFWSINNSKALKQINTMTLLQEKMQKDVKIISFASELKSAVKEYMRKNPMEIVVIPNGEVFGQMAYGAEMGNPRMFIIDKSGIIKAAIPEQAFEDNDNLFISLESILNGM